jgi:hypothetical protein
MSDFIADTVTVTTTSTKFADAAEFDRRVFIDVSTGFNDQIFAGFTNVTGARLDSGGQQPIDFVLPAGQELWLYVGSGSPSIGLLVTKP